MSEPRLDGPGRRGASTLEAEPQTLRFALISTPRSGNTWLRHLTASVLGLEQLPIYNPLEADWDHLPARCVLMTHWERTEPLLSRLREGGFRVLTLARHPLDVLVSILHFTVHNPETGRWLDGRCGDERSIVGKAPLSPEFLRYATGERAKLLLSVSREWWHEPGCHRVRYEDLVRETAETLAGLSSLGGEASGTPVDEAIAAHTLEKLRSREGLHHWRGRPGQWRMLLPAAPAREIAAAHEGSFREFGYTCDPDEGLTDDQAEANWSLLACVPRRGE